MAESMRRRETNSTIDEDTFQSYVGVDQSRRSVKEGQSFTQLEDPFLNLLQVGVRFFLRVRSAGLLPRLHLALQWVSDDSSLGRTTKVMPLRVPSQRSIQCAFLPTVQPSLR